MHNLELGKKGENLAEKFLKNKGFKILAKNFKTYAGEIDLIAQDKKVLVFIEVKTRRNLNFGEPKEAVNYFKQNKIKENALIYLEKNKLKFEDLRFDVISILFNQEDLIKIEHLQGAF